MPVEAGIGKPGRVIFELGLGIAWQTSAREHVEPRPF